MHSFDEKRCTTISVKKTDESSFLTLFNDYAEQFAGEGRAKSSAPLSNSFGLRINK